MGVLLSRVSWNGRGWGGPQCPAALRRGLSTAATVYRVFFFYRVVGVLVFYRVELLVSVASLFYGLLLIQKRVSLCITEFYRVLPSFTELRPVFSSFTAFLPSCTGFLPSFAELFPTLADCYWVLPSFSEFHRVLPGFTEFCDFRKVMEPSVAVDHVELDVLYLWLKQVALGETLIEFYRVFFLITEFNS